MKSKRTIKIVSITDRELSRFYKVPFSGPVLGIAGRMGLLTVGAGGIVHCDDGRVWGFIDLLPRARTPVLYRYVKRFLDERREEGVKEIYVTRDASFSTSEAFLKRIGFHKTNETYEGNEVWVWLASAQ